MSFQDETRMAAMKNTPEVKAAIIASVRSGAYAKHAAAAVGINESTLYDWINAEPEFAQAVARARAEATNSMLRVVVNAGPEDWRAAAWYLERTDPTNFRESSQVEHAGSVTLEQVLASDIGDASDGF